MVWKSSKCQTMKHHCQEQHTISLSFLLLLRLRSSDCSHVFDFFSFSCSFSRCISIEVGIEAKTKRETRDADVFFVSVWTNRSCSMQLSCQRPTTTVISMIVCVFDILVYSSFTFIILLHRDQIPEETLLDSIPIRTNR